MEKLLYPTTQDILKDRQNSFLINNPGSRILAINISLQSQKQLYAESTADENEREVQAFKGQLQFDEQIGITGSSTYSALRFDQKALRKRNMWLPGYLEAKALEAQGKLENNVYRDYGLVLYNPEAPNGELSKELASQVKELDLELPLIIPFRSLEYRLDKEKLLISIATRQNIISGNKARKELERIDTKNKSGAVGLSFGREGGWNTSWDLTASYDYGRIDWVCSELQT